MNYRDFIKVVILAVIIFWVWFAITQGADGEIRLEPTMQFYETSFGWWQAPNYRVIEMTATITGYSSSPDETWGDPFLTASGERVGPETIACPRKIPFGSVVEIDWGQYICRDWLAEKYDYRFDIWFPTKQAAKNFGIRTVPIIIYIFY